MDATPRPNSSNVTVEYTDPSNLFPLVEPLLLEVRQLRNLHWKSPTRPLRSIGCLQIDFVAAQTPEERKRLSDGTSGAATHRRHQIPGLRRTPYLKIYLLRCDDNETYKATSRKLVREWVKAKGSGSQDNHDACEWLVIHVVEANGSRAEVPEKPGPMAKWPGRSSTSVLEKLKADFNGSSKSAIDRVVQLKIPTPDANKRLPELSVQLEDLVTKLKSSILTSFDLRVAQYEEDIREKDSQRSLPGWNFCTFFILKEGLALGFENVGLYEDALVGYDELSAGLDAALRDQMSGAGDQHGGTLLAYSEEMKSRAEAALSSGVAAPENTSADRGENPEADETPSKHSTFSDPVELDPEDFPCNPHKRPYRDMIVANNISVFDFRAYIFSRQMQLLLKAAEVPSSAKTSLSGQQGTKSKETHDLALLAEICDRASEFVTLASRILRRDLANAVSQLEKKYDENAVAEVVDNLVYSWSYATVSQVLVQTSVGALDVPRVSLRTSKDLADASILTSFGGESRDGVPQRSSSLITASTSHMNSPRPDSPHSFGFNPSSPAKRSLTALIENEATIKRAGAIELASARGDLCILARRILETLGRKRGWDQRWHDLSLLFDEDDTQATTFIEVSLNNQDIASRDQPATAQKPPPLLAGIETPILQEALKSVDQFNLYYEKLTDEIFRHHVAATRIKSAESAMADMALWKYRQEDYATAASYFNHLASFYGDNNWEALEGVMLELYARCLKKLGRKEDFVRTSFKLLGKYTGTIISKSKPENQREKVSLPAESKVPEYMSELFEASRALPKNYALRLRDFFATPTIDPRIIHFDDKDGFQLQVSLRLLLAENITIDCVKVRLVNSSDIKMNELWLETPGQVVVRESTTKVLLETPTTAQGEYFVDRIELRVGNIIFSHGASTEDSLSPTYKDLSNRESADENIRTSIICYPRAAGIEAKISHPSLIDLGGRRSIEIDLTSGSNRINNGVIRLKPATAGLRLLVSEMEIVNGFIKFRQNATSGHIEFSEFGPDASTTLGIPYTVEGSQSTLIIRLEIEYQTDNGKFLYLTAKSVLTTLPVSVNVQDVFMHDALFSRFTISPAMMIPLKVFDCQMPGTQSFSVQSSMLPGEIFDVFPKQPASLLYKIKPEGKSKERGSRALRLTVDFTCLNEECLATLENQFKKDLEKSPFSHLRCLLLPHLLGAFSSQWTADSLEKIGLLREIDVFPYERMQWQAVTRTLGRGLEQQVTEWLTLWHKQRQVLPLQDRPPPNTLRQIVIPVDMPEIQVVHTAELVLHNISPSQPHAAVGEAIRAELILRHTRRWCPEDVREPQAELEFMYEIITNTDIWLVGGRRRGNFTASEGQTRSFPLMLIPQVPGHLILPSVEVKTFVAQQSQADPLALPQRRPISSEVDYRSHGMTILVTPNLSKTTVSVDMVGPSGSGAWLIDSEKRVVPAS
ncbi:transmembrane protein 1 [Coccidioides immitis RMSCC 3703]|uniref:Transmembrane protein 1 n=1 Tax=Coccidioides immitis RMSCC 3703 TaxID=454286 RepID=A0A0J8QSG8_COCIT|nr:transmembrane protein 1 [Coccidioides immitis RMSCC 3703]